MALLQSIHRAHTSAQPLVMGVVNVTPDSFSDGGFYHEPNLAIEHALALVGEGADLLDVGGESTRPGAKPVALEEELARVVPVIRGISARTDCPISIDSTKPEVMEQALAAGASMINDVNALQAKGAIEVAKASRVPVVLMHMQGNPQTMQQKPHYSKVVEEVALFLRQRLKSCVENGMDPTQIVLDPGFGFGKALGHNIALLAQFDELVLLGHPVLAGVSRKSMLGAITGREDPKDRQAASVGAALWAANAGAAILRVHDVAATVDALAVWNALRDHKNQHLLDAGREQ